MQSSKCHYSIMLIVTKNYTTKVTGDISTFKTVIKSTNALVLLLFHSVFNFMLNFSVPTKN